jgi:antirestriction protein ArdC
MYHLSINERIIDSLKNKQMPWYGQVHKNFVSKAAFDGINPIILNLISSELELKSHWWATLLQWEMLGVKINPRPTSVQAGSWGARLSLYKRDNCGINKLKPWTVFNIEQTVGGFDGDRKIVKEAVKHEAADKMAVQSKAKIKYGGNESRYYYPPFDHIALPFREQFVIGAGGLPGYYYSLFHELMHWSEIRLGYEADYASCELRSEIGTAYLCAEFGIDPIKYEHNLNHQEQMGAWIKRMKDDPFYIFDVADAASKGVKYLMDFTK